MVVMERSWCGVLVVIYFLYCRLPLNVINSVQGCRFLTILYYQLKGVGPCGLGAGDWQRQLSIVILYSCYDAGTLARAQFILHYKRVTLLIYISYTLLAVISDTWMRAWQDVML